MKIKNRIANLLYECRQDPELAGGAIGLFIVAIMLVVAGIITKGILFVILASIALIIYCLHKFFSWVNKWIDKNKTVED